MNNIKTISKRILGITLLLLFVPTLSGGVAYFFGESFIDFFIRILGMIGVIIIIALVMTGFITLVRYLLTNGN